MSMTLKQWRRVRDLTQEKMATLLNVHPNTIASWEKNPGSIPVGKLSDIFKVLNVTFDDVIFLPEESTNM